MIAFIYEIDLYIKKTKTGSVTEDICRFLEFLNKSKYDIGKSVNINTDDRFFDIDQQIGPEDSRRFLKQKSNSWFSRRVLTKVTGSTIYKAVGCDGLGKQKDHFEKVVCGTIEPSEDIRAVWNMVLRMRSMLLQLLWER